MKTSYSLPLLLSRVEAGFPSPADDHLDRTLDLNEYLIEHRAATFFVRVSGDSMINAGIEPNDILIVDRSREAKHSDIVVAILDNEFTVKRFLRMEEQVILRPENSKFPDLIIEEGGLEIWGVVTAVIRKY